MSDLLSYTCTIGNLILNLAVLLTKVSFHNATNEHEAQRNVHSWLKRFLLLLINWLVILKNQNIGKGFV